MSSQKELIPMRPGDILRHEREQKGISLERAALESRIRPAVLEAVESGETGHIPSVYLKGHIRSYARYLGLDPASIEEKIEEVQGAEPEVRSVFTSSPNRGGSEKWLKVSGYLAASVMIAALAWQFTHQAVRFSQGETGLQTAAQTVTELTGTSDPLREASRAGGRSHLNASIASVEVLQDDGQAVSGSNAAEDAWAALRNPDGGHELALTTSADTWVEIYGEDGKQMEMDLIRAGESRVYQGPGPFRVMIGRASAVELSLDGESVDLGPHTSDNVASLVLAEVAEGDSETPENH